MIRFTRRAFGALIAAAAMTAAPALAQDYPSRAINIVVPYAPGGQGDITARLIAEHLTSLVGQPVTVENKAGANGVIGISEIAKAQPDGYTLGVVVASHAMARALVPNLPYDPVTDFTPITTTAMTDMVLVVPPSLKVDNLKQFIDLAKSKPGQMAYKSAGQGSNSHLFAAWFADAAGLDMIHIPYKGSGDSIPDLLAGVTQMGFDTVPAVRGYLENGQLKAIAAGGPKRVASMPDLPTVAEQGLEGFAANSWGMVIGPKGLPAADVAYLNEKIVEVLNMPAVKDKFQSMGAQVVGDTPDQAREMLTKEEANYTALISKLHISMTQ